MNQRAGKTHRAAASDGMADMKLRNFFRDAAGILERSGHVDCSFFFEQCADHITSGKSLPSESREIERVFGL